MKTCNQKTDKGFTLVELLVVVTVIGLLVGLSVPAISSALAKARLTESMTNLRQIGVGLELCLQDNNRVFPNENGGLVFTSATLPDLGYSTNWREVVHRYVDTNYRSGNGYNFYTSDLWYTRNANRVGNHYGLNVFMILSFWNFDFRRITNPAELVIIGEINSGGHYIDPRVDPDFRGDISSNYRISQPNNSSLYLFADGHVEALSGIRDYTAYREMWRFD